MLKPAIEQAIAQVRATFEGCNIDVVEDGQGGAAVTVRDIDYGPQYTPARGWIGFVITFQYDAADVYPHLLVPGISRLDGKPLGEGFGTATWNGGPSTQVSRRSHGWRPGVDTAAGKLVKVIQWIRTR